MKFVKKNMKFTIRTEITINASKEKIWNTMMDFEAYPKWNPFIEHISGKKEVGAQLKAHLGGMKFKPFIIDLEENKRFSWIGKLFFKGLFDGEHIFIIEETEKGCVFRQDENFSGILVPLFKKKLNTETKSQFEAMNRALKEQVE